MLYTETDLEAALDYKQVAIFELADRIRCYQLKQRSLNITANLMLYTEAVQKAAMDKKQVEFLLQLIRYYHFLHEKV